jgi:hypothetical protein
MSGGPHECCYCVDGTPTTCAECGRQYLMVSGEEVAAMKDALQEVGRIAEKAAHKFWNEATTAEDGLAVARALRAVVRAASPPEIPPDEEPICECSFPLREHRVGYSRSQCKFVLRGASQPGGTPIVPGEAPRLTPDEEALVNALRSVVGGSMTVLGRDGMAGLLRIIERLLRGRPEPEGERLTEAHEGLVDHVDRSLSMGEWQPAEARRAKAEAIVRAALRDAPPQDGERLTKALREAMEGLAIAAHLDRGTCFPEDREPPGEYEYENKAWWELPEDVKQHFRSIIAQAHPEWTEALRGSGPTEGERLTDVSIHTVGDKEHVKDHLPKGGIVETNVYATAEADSFDAFYKALTAEAQVFGVDPTVAQALCASLAAPHRWLWVRLESANRQADAYAEQIRLLRSGGPTPEGERPTVERLTVLQEAAAVLRWYLLHYGNTGGAQDTIRRIEEACGE